MDFYWLNGDLIRYSVICVKFLSSQKRSKPCIEKGSNEFGNLTFLSVQGYDFSLQWSKVFKGSKWLYPGDLVTRTGDREIRCLSGRLPDNPGELHGRQTSRHRVISRQIEATDSFHGLLHDVYNVLLSMLEWPG